MPILLILCLQVSYGGYRLGANSANILVQDRMTGMINEERMSVYVRLGIRLLYKGLKSREMEKKRGRHKFCCLALPNNISSAMPPGDSRGPTSPTHHAQHLFMLRVDLY